jgi:hypothetical protein
MYLSFLKRLLLLLTIVLVSGYSLPGSSGGGRTSPTPTPTLVEGSELRSRPLHIPSIAPGAPCPTVAGRTFKQGLGPGQGDGPVYAFGQASFGQDGVLRYAPAANFRSTEWGGDRTIWAVTPTYQGLVLIRGRQADGSNVVRFEEGALPIDELLFNAESDPNANEGWVYQTSYTRLRSPGCYGFQVDGPDFSYVIIFQAVASQQ